MTPSPACGWILAVTGALPCLACGGADVTLGDGRSTAEARTFRPPVRIDALSIEGSVDDDPSLTRDLRTLYFNSKRPGGAGREDIWSSRRESVPGTWEAPAAVESLNTDARETGIAITGDGLTLWFSSDREGSEGLDVYVARRSGPSDPWTEPMRVSELCTSGDDLVSAIDARERTIVLARRVDQDANYDLFVSTRAGIEAPWAPPAPLASLNTDAEETDGFPTEQPAELWFTRSGDLYTARRDDGDELEFGPAAPVDALNSDGDDRDAWVAVERRYVIFSSDRDGDYRLYESGW